MAERYGHLLRAGLESLTYDIQANGAAFAARANSLPDAKNYSFPVNCARFGVAAAFLIVEGPLVSLAVQEPKDD